MFKSQSIPIGTHVCFELYVLYLLKLPAPPRAALCYKQFTNYIHQSTNYGSKFSPQSKLHLWIIVHPSSTRFRWMPSFPPKRKRGMLPRCRQVFATKAEEILVTFVQNLPEAPVRWRPAPLDPEQVEEDDLERPCPQQAGLLASPSCLSCLLGRFGGCKRKALYLGR